MFKKSRLNPNTMFFNELNKTLTVVKQSPFGIIREFTFSSTKLESQRFREGKEYIQNIYPNLDSDEREWLISGSTPEEWNKLFDEE